jgi:hypothetical protein
MEEPKPIARERLRNEGNDKQVKQERLIRRAPKRFQSLLSLVPPFLSYRLHSRTIFPLVPPLLPYHHSSRTTLLKTLFHHCAFGPLPPRSASVTGLEIQS